jgi:hypothetical protein
MKGSDKMKSFLLIAIVLLLLALDWAASHDILKGEASLYGEYGIVSFSVMAFGVLFLVRLTGLTRRGAKTPAERRPEHARPESIEGSKSRLKAVSKQRTAQLLRLGRSKGTNIG